MSTIEQVAAHLRHILNQIQAAHRAITHAQAQLTQSIATFAGVLRGSDGQESSTVATQLTQAHQTLTGTQAILAATDHHIVHYLATLGVPATTTQAEPSRAPQDRIESLRRQLPPPIERGENGRKTHGRWIGPDGAVHSSVSGYDGNSAIAWGMVQHAVGLTREPTTLAHVELKVAAQMVHDKIKSVTLVINNVPCGKKYGCANLLPVLLPAGYSMTVHGPNNYKRTFIGGAVWPWR